jgi:hypothetical protein
MCLTQESGLSNRIDSIRFSFEKLQKPFDSISIRFKKRFDTKLHQQWCKKIGHQENGQFSKGLSIMHEYLTIHFKIQFCKFFMLSCRSSTCFLFRFLSRSNRIVSKIEIVIRFDLDTIRFWFDLTALSRMIDSLFVNFMNDQNVLTFEYLLLCKTHPRSGCVQLINDWFLLNFSAIIFYLLSLSIMLVFLPFSFLSSKIV